MVAPWWHVRLDATSNSLSFAFVTDFFTGAILSQSANVNGDPVDPNSEAFRVGQGVTEGVMASAITAYVVGRALEGGALDELGTLTASAILLGGTLSEGIGGFFGCQDKLCRANFLGGMVDGFGWGIVGYFFAGSGVQLPNLIVEPNPVAFALWTAYWVEYESANVDSKPILFFSALTAVLATGEAFLLESSM